MGRGFPNITTIRGALWSSDTELEIQNPTDEKWAFRVQETSTLGVHKVPAFSICSILNKIGADWIDILKVDIEGAEKELFDESSAQWIRKLPGQVDTANGELLASS